jgi:RNA polymerase sigma-70 factor (ECF subfamily)
MLAVSVADEAPAEGMSDVADQAARLAAHEPLAWQELIDGYFRKMHRFAYVRTGDVHLSEEIASEVFVAAVRGIKRYKPTGAPIAAWLFRIARNITADHLERRSKRPTTSIDDVQLETPGFAAQMDELTDLAEAMRHLTREQQEVITLRFVSDCSVIETAAALGKSEGAVKLLQHRAITSLRREMTKGTPR